MFKKLRNKFILTNMLTTTAILLVSFVSIFVFATAGGRHERPHAPREFEQSNEMREVFENEIKLEREDQAGRLLVTLIMVGLSVEILVFIVSYVMAERSVQPVEDAYRKQREFIANASHELKTPIAAVQANFEALGATEQPWVDNIENELTRASNLVSDLLTLARTDGRIAAIAKKDVDVVKVVRSRAKLIEVRLGDKELKIEAPEKQNLNMNEADFTQILDILLDNAVKYSKKTIKIQLSSHLLTVENDGKTIPVEKLNKLFERFYQVDKTSEGSGLGLAIAKAIADQNKWKIWAESDKTGTKFSVSF